MGNGYVRGMWVCQDSPLSVASQCKLVSDSELHRRIAGGAAAPPICWRSRKFLGCRKFLDVSQKFSPHISTKPHSFFL